MAVVKTAADEFSAEVYNFVAGCCKGICLCAASGENKFAVFYCKRFDKRQFSGVPEKTLLKSLALKTAISKT